MKNLIIAMLLLFSIQTNSQEIKTREDAITIIKNSIRSRMDIQYTYIGINGTEEYKYFSSNKWEWSALMINEYLIIHGTHRDAIEKTKVEILLNLKDTFILKKEYGWKDTKAEKYYRLAIQHNNIKIGINGFIPHPYDVSSAYRRKILFEDDETVKKIYSALLVLSSTLDSNEKTDLKLSKFKDESTKIGVSKEISEEQRRYIVQANAANNNKDYTTALMMYQKAIEVNKISYPNAYFNMALIYAELNQYYQAIFAMKQYLILAPDAEDARKAQDKIYEWELNIVKL